MAILERAIDLETRSRSAEFCQIARCLAVGDSWSAGADVAKNNNLVPRIIEVMQKSAVSPGVMSSALSSSGLVSAFVDSLRHYGAFDAMLPSMVRVPFKTKVAITTTAATGFVIGEGHAKRLSSLSLTGTELAPRKAVAIILISNELARSMSSPAISLFSNSLKSSVAQATDAEFLSILTSGITPTASSGSTEAAVRQDIRTLLAAVTTGNTSSLFFVTTSAIAKGLAMVSDDNNFPDMKYNGGSLVGIPVVVSDAVTAGQLILVDAAQIAAASDDVILDSANHITLQMETSPDSPPTASTVMHNAWQHDEVAIKCERYYGAERLRTSAVAIISGVAPTGDSP